MVTARVNQYSRIQSSYIGHGCTTDLLWPVSVPTRAYLPGVSDVTVSRLLPEVSDKITVLPDWVAALRVPTLPEVRAALKASSLLMPVVGLQQTVQLQSAGGEVVKLAMFPQALS